ncbi:MAG: helix-turn-helix domain-containing protein [Acidobacteriota bacterium]
MVRSSSIARPGPAGGRRDLNRQKRRSDIAAAGLELFLARGIEAVAIDDIVKKAGVAKGSFYRYFRDKADLVEAILEPVSRGMQDAFSRGTDALGAARDRQKLVAAYQILAQSLAMSVMARPAVARLYLQESRAPRHGAARPVRRLADLIAREALALTRIARENHLLRPVDPVVSSLAVIGAVERLLFGVLAEQVPLNPISASGELISMVLDGLRPPATADRGR